MKRLVLACLLLAAPAMAQDGRRWVLVENFGGQLPPRFHGPFAERQACDDRLGALREQARTARQASTDAFEQAERTRSDVFTRHVPRQQELALRIAAGRGSMSSEYLELSGAIADARAEYDRRLAERNTAIDTDRRLQESALCELR